MTPADRQSWIWPEQDDCECKACRVKTEVDKLKYEKERRYYAKAKGQLYPRTQQKDTLRRIHSNEEWQGTASFYESWRMPSSLAHLFQPFMGERKGTGFVGDSKGTSDDGGGGGGGGGGEGGGGSGSGTASSSERHAAQLEALDEELEAVEEESLPDDDGSVRGGAVESADKRGETSIKVA